MKRSDIRRFNRKKWAYELAKEGYFFDVDDTMYDHLHPTRDALRTVLGLSERFPFEKAYHRIRYYSDVLSAKGGLLEGRQGRMNWMR